MRIKLSLITLIFLLVTIIVLFSEPAIINYFVDGHQSWVSLHSLAIVKNSSFNSGFVGYTCKNISLDGSIKYLYFNRYPALFAVITKFILSPWQETSEKYLYFARQIMNIIYLMNLVFLYKISRKFSFSRFTSIAGVLVTGSSVHWLYYKSMFHFDQPALLALTISIYLIIDLLKIPNGYEKSNNRKFYFCIVPLLLIGRSINILFLLTSCLILSFTSRRNIFFKIRKQLLISISIGFLILLINLIYNVYVESVLNNVDWGSTSIIDSLTRRIELIKFFDFNDNTQPLINNKNNWFGSFFPRIIVDILFFFSPVMGMIFSIHALNLIFNFFSINYSFNISKFFNKAQYFFGKNNLEIIKNRNTLFEIFKALSITYILWTIIFSNLIFAHDYASMFIIPLLFLGTVYIFELYWKKFNDLNSKDIFENKDFKNAYLNIIKSRKILIPSVLIILFLNFCLSIHLFANHSLSRTSKSEEFELSRFFRQIDLLNKYAIREDNNNLFITFDKNWMPGSPYAMCSLINQPLYSENFNSNNESNSKIKLPKLNSERIANRISIKYQTFEFLKKYFKN